MSQEVIVVTGVSGVGKSTLLSRMASSHVFQQLSASDLIAAADEQDILEPNIGEKLRKANIGDNQLKLISEFHKQKDTHANCIVLDAHVLIDTPNGYIQIEPEVFAEIGVSRIVNLIENPQNILARRRADTTRNRPRRSKSELAEYQESAQAQCCRIAIALEIPLLNLPISLAGHLASLLPPRAAT